MKWHFSPQLADQVETEITQRDQFNNDEVNISETIVREAVQNSLDAATDDEGVVSITFKWLDSSTGIDPSYFKRLFEGQVDHARKADLKIDALNFEVPRALVIEDFGTSGLTGSINTKDDSHFCDFWRRHGKSHKTGKSRGRWGLGKLVYSATSQIGAFFGVTSRAGDEAQYLMGQTVLNLRTVDGRQYPPHAFFADVEGDDPYTRITVPIKDEVIVEDFCQNFSIDRTGAPGLSVVIPFPDPSISKERMIGVAIGNYFYPLITGKLKLKFDELNINAENVRDLAKVYAHDRFDQIDILFDFIEEIYRAEQHHLLQLRSSWLEDKKLDESDFEPEDLEAMREKFERGQLVGVELPVTIRKKGGDEESKFSCYIKRPADLEKGLDMYVRGGLTLPAEVKFGGRRALGAMIAEDEAVCAFLGDAENAAHTRWISNTEKLRRGYRNNQHTALLVAVIRRSVVELYDLLAQVTEEKDEDALLDFFWFEEPESEKPKRTKKKKDPKPVREIVVSNKPIYRISQIKEGFHIDSTEDFSEENLPREVKIEAAYDVGSGNPFKKYSPHDFKVGKGGSIKLGATKGTQVISSKENKWVLEINSLPFKLTATGFDENRDLKISVK
jgi:hypothetical protein